MPNNDTIEFSVKEPLRSERYDWIEFSSKEHPLRLKKEILTVGEWRKGDRQYNITLDFVNHVKDGHYQLLADEIKTPLVLSHKGESSYADVSEVLVEKNRKGRDALFAIFDFKDKASYDEAKRNDVSVFIPPKRLAGNGKEYVRVLEHVALTPWPVVPGLADWEAIAASMSFAQEKTTVLLEEIIALLELEIPDGASDETIEALALNAVKAMKKELDELKGTGGEEEGDPVPDPEAIAASQRRHKRNALPSFKPGAELITMVRTNRQAALDRLVESECITASVRDELAKDYISDDVISLSLSNTDDDGFNKLVAKLAKNKVTPAKGRIGADDFIELSHDGGGKVSSLKADAKKRAEQHEARQKRGRR